MNENSFHSSRKTGIFIEILCLVSRILMCRIGKYCNLTKKIRKSFINILFGIKIVLCKKY